MVALATSSFDTTVLVLGGLLVLGAFLAGLLIAASCRSPRCS